jgi:hypothetical protein
LNRENIDTIFTLQIHCTIKVDNLQKLEDGYGIIYNLKSSDSPADLPEGLVLNLIKPFNDDEFSDYEIGVLQAVADEYGKLDSEQLIGMLHQEGTLWHKLIQANNLEQQFELKSNHLLCPQTFHRVGEGSLSCLNHYNKQCY